MARSILDPETPEEEARRLAAFEARRIERGKRLGGRRLDLTVGDMDALLEVHRSMDVYRRRVNAALLGEEED